MSMKIQLKFESCFFWRGGGVLGHQKGIALYEAKEDILKGVEKSLKKVTGHQILK